MGSLSELEAKAKAGDVQAMVALGDAIIDQSETLRDNLMGAEWYNRAADMGSVDGAIKATKTVYAVARALYDANEINESFSYFQTASQHALKVTHNAKGGSGDDAFETGMRLLDISSYGMASILYFSGQYKEAARCVLQFCNQDMERNIILGTISALEYINTREDFEQAVMRLVAYIPERNYVNKDILGTGSWYEQQLYVKGVKKLVELVKQGYVDEEINAMGITIQVYCEEIVRRARNAITDKMAVEGLNAIII